MIYSIYPYIHVAFKWNLCFQRYNLSGSMCHVKGMLNIVERKQVPVIASITADLSGRPLTGSPSSFFLLKLIRQLVMLLRKQKA